MTQHDIDVGSSSPIKQHEWRQWQGSSIAADECLLLQKLPHWSVYLEYSDLWEDPLTVLGWRASASLSLIQCINYVSWWRSGLTSWCKSCIPIKLSQSQNLAGHLACLIWVWLAVFGVSEKPPQRWGPHTPACTLLFLLCTSRNTTPRSKWQNSSAAVVPFLYPSFKVEVGAGTSGAEAVSGCCQSPNLPLDHWETDTGCALRPQDFMCTWVIVFLPVVVYTDHNPFCIPVTNVQR